jgi:hypothetical protein
MAWQFVGLWTRSWWQQSPLPPVMSLEASQLDHEIFLLGHFDDGFEGVLLFLLHRKMWARALCSPAFGCTSFTYFAPTSLYTRVTPWSTHSTNFALLKGVHLWLMFAPTFLYSCNTLVDTFTRFHTTDGNMWNRAMKRSHPRDHASQSKTSSASLSSMETLATTPIDESASKWESTDEWVRRARKYLHALVFRDPGFALSQNLVLLSWYA